MLRYQYELQKFANDIALDVGLYARIYKNPAEAFKREKDPEALKENIVDAIVKLILGTLCDKEPLLIQKAHNSGRYNYLTSYADDIFNKMLLAYENYMAGKYKDKDELKSGPPIKAKDRNAQTHKDFAEAWAYAELDKLTHDVVAEMTEKMRLLEQKDGDFHALAWAAYLTAVGTFMAAAAHYALAPSHEGEKKLGQPPATPLKRAHDTHNEQNRKAFPTPPQ